MTIPEHAPAASEAATPVEAVTPLEASAPVSTPVIDPELVAELPAFELFFKTFGFKRVHGRVWGLLVMASEPLASKDITSVLALSQAATSGALNELAEWGAVRSTFDSARRCHVHAPVGNALSIVATVFRRREQVVFQQFKLTAERALDFVRGKYGERDPRVLTLRSIIATCAIGEAMMQLVFSAVHNAMNDSESVLSRAVHTALKVGVGKPARWLFSGTQAFMAGTAPTPPSAHSAVPEPEPDSPLERTAPPPATATTRTRQNADA